jgi:hypothetical protein
MARLYCSFLIRCRRLERGERRIEVRHIQSGGHTRVASLVEGMEWMDSHCGASALERPALPARPHRSGKEVLPGS